MDEKIEEIVKRPVRYQYIDGIYEMCAGILLMGVVFLKPWWLAGLTAAVLWGQMILKKRITYPRTGYVKLQGAGTKPWIWGIIGFAAAFAAVLVFRHLSHSLMVLLGSAAWAVIYAYMTRLAKLENAWRWIAVLAMIAIPVTISLLPLDRRRADMLSIVFLALVFLASGAITFILYLHRTQPPERVAE